MSRKATEQQVEEALAKLNGEVTDEFQKSHAAEIASNRRRWKAEEAMEKLLESASKTVMRYITSRIGNVNFDGRPFFIDFTNAGDRMPKMTINAHWRISRLIYATGSRHRVTISCEIWPKSVEQLDRAIADFQAAEKAIAENA